MRKSGHRIENNNSFTTNDSPKVSPAKAAEMCRSGAAIIDIRGAYLTAFKKFDVPEVIYLPEPGKSIPFKNLEKKKTYIVAETSTSVTSREIVRLLLNEDFQLVYNLAGGFVEWERNGLPVIENKNARLSGSCMCQLSPRDK